MRTCWRLKLWNRLTDQGFWQLDFLAGLLWIQIRPPDPDQLDIWGKNGSIFCMVIAIFVNKAYHQYAWGYNFHIRTNPKKISVTELGIIFQGSPLFLALLGLCRFISISTLNFGPFSTQLGGTVRAIKKITQMTTDPIQCPAGRVFHYRGRVG